MNRIRMTSLVFGFLAFFLFSLHASAQFEAPGSLQHTSNTTSTISWVWDDNSDNEQGFTCYSWSWGNVGTNSSGWIRGPKIWEVPADITSYTETGLSINTQYKRIVVVWKDNGFSREEVPSASWDHVTGNYYYGQTYPRSATPTASPPDYLVGVYTSIQPPSGLAFGPKGMNDLNVRLASLPSNITAGNSGFFIENTFTQGNLSSPVFFDGGLTSWYNPARPITGEAAGGNITGIMILCPP